MAYSRGKLSLLILATLMIAMFASQHAQGALPGGRMVFVSSLSNALSTGVLSPSKPTLLSNSSLPVQLQLPPIIGPNTCPQVLASCSSISGGGQFSASLWMASNSSSTIHAQVLATLKPIGVSLGTSSALALNSTVREYNVSYTMPNFDVPLRPGLALSISLSFETSPPTPSSGIVVFSGPNELSSVVVPYANYAVIESVKVSDYRGAENQTFNIQAPATQNIVFITAIVHDVFVNDISYVNFTITGPRGIVKGETNATMSLFCPQQPCNQPAQYQSLWVYPPDSPQGTYSLVVSMVDAQGNVIPDTSAPGGVRNFGIGPIPPGFPLLLFVGVVAPLGAAGAASSVVYLRRRRTREYLAPFSYFERLTGGEVPGGSMVTVEGNTGAGKTTLCSEIMYEDLKRGRPCLYVAADDFPDRIRDQMRSLGIDVAGYERSGLLTFVDCYSAEAGRTPTEKFYVPSVGDLTTLGVKISSALSEPVQGSEQKGTCLYLDSISPFVPRTKPESIVAFVHAIGARVRGIDGKAFFTMSTGSDTTIRRQLEDMADCVIQMEAFEEKDVRRRRLRIRKFRNRPHQEGWATFTIESGKGIIFYTRKTGRNN